MKVVRLAIMVAASLMAVALAPPADADPDTDFAAELQTYGIYGQRDYNAWIGKISCKRLHRGVDADAFQSADFVLTNLPRDSTTQQAYQFLGAAIRFYCPDQMPVLARVAEQPS